MLTYAAYQMDGGVAGAIGRWAEDTYNGLTEAEQQLARRVFTRLVHYGEGDAADTRQRRALPELLTQPDERDALHRLLQRLADKRLITTDEAQGVEFVEIIHDALLKEWPRLEQWSADQREFLLWRQRLEAYLRTWEAQDRDDSALLRGALLAEAERWAKAQPEELNPDERAYIAQSVALREREQAEREKQQRWLKIALAVTLLLFLFAAGAAWVATQQTDLAERRLGEARNAEATAIAEAHIRATAQAETEAQRVEAVTERDRAEQQAQIALARQLGMQAQYLLDTQMTQLPRAMLLTVESLRRYPESTGTQALGAGLHLLPHEIARMTHQNIVNTVAFSSDAKWVVSGSWDGTARVWEATTGSEVSHMIHEGRVRFVVFSPDGRWIVSGGYDSPARVWEAATGKEIARMEYVGDVTALAFSSNGQWVVSGSYPGVAQVWQAATGEEILRVQYQGGDATMVAFSPDGQQVVLTGCDTVEYFDCGSSSIQIWDVVNRKETTRMIHPDKVLAVAFSPDGQWVASAGGPEDATARVWDAHTGREVARLTHEGGVTSIAFSPDGQWVVSGGYDNIARVWEAGTGREVSRIVHESHVNDVAFSPNGQWVVSGGADNTARVWDAATGQMIAQMTYGGIVEDVMFSPDGQWVVSGGHDNTARVWKPTTGQEMARMTHKYGVGVADFSSDGQWIVSAGCDSVDENGGCISGSDRVWETNTGREIARMTHAGYARIVAFSPDNQWVASAENMNNIAQVWKAITGQEAMRIFHGEHIDTIAFSPDGRRIVSVGCDVVDSLTQVSRKFTRGISNYHG